MNICPYLFSGALAKDSEDPDKCLRKAMTKVKIKLTELKTRKSTIVEYLDYQIPVTQLMGPKRD